MGLIIWQGFGWLVPIIVFGCCLAMEFTVELNTGDSEFYQNNMWCLSLAFSIASCLVGFLAWILTDKRDRIVQDVETGEKIILRARQDSFFSFHCDIGRSLFWFVLSCFCFTGLGIPRTSDKLIHWIRLLSGCYFWIIINTEAYISLTIPLSPKK